MKIEASDAVTTLEALFEEEVSVRGDAATPSTHSSTYNHLWSKKNCSINGHEWTSVNVTSQCSNGTRAVEVNTSSFTTAPPAVSVAAPPLRDQQAGNPLQREQLCRLC